MAPSEQAATGPSTGLSVIERVAAAEGVDPADLPPLNHTVDVDAINRLVATHDDAADGRIEFTYVGRRVTVRFDGDVSIEATD